MNFNLVRMGWPNTAAILALAIMPVAALTAANDRSPKTTQVEQIEAAAICLTPAGCSVVMAATAPEIVVE